MQDGPDDPTSSGEVIGEGPPTVEPLDEIEIGGAGKTTFIGSLLPPDEKVEWTDFLTINRDVFAWSFEDMPGIDPAIACHRLNVCSTARPVVQK
jgi:hypothetical protein